MAVVIVFEVKKSKKILFFHFFDLIADLDAKENLMANRPVFESKTTYPYYVQRDVEFVWVAGMSAVQKRKCALSLHDAYHRIFPDRNVLEASTKSTEPLGLALSPFNLKLFVPSLNRMVPEEVVYHAAKVFEHGGPYLDLYDAIPSAAKHDVRLKDSGRIIAFHFEGRDFPTQPKELFSAWLYIRALLDNKDLLEQICEYDAFTDIEFNPKHSIACQARALAIAVGLRRSGQIEKVRDFKSFLSLMMPPKSEPEKKAPVAVEIPSVSVGDKLDHVVFGVGEVLSADGDRAIVRFADGSEKKMGITFLFRNELVKKC